MRTPFSIKSLFVFLLMTAISLGGCVETRSKASSSGSTGTVIDFGAPILMAVAVVPDGTGPYSLSGITYRLSLWKRIKNDGSSIRYFISDQPPGAELTLEVSLRSIAGFIRAAQGSANPSPFSTLNGYTVVTTPIVTSDGQRVPVLFTAKEGLAAVSAPGLAASYGCLGVGNAFISGKQNNLVSFSSPNFSTASPVVATISESSGIRYYRSSEVGFGASPPSVAFALDGKSACTTTIDGQAFTGFPVSPMVSLSTVSTLPN